MCTSIVIWSWKDNILFLLEYINSILRPIYFSEMWELDICYITLPCMCSKQMLYEYSNGKTGFSFYWRFIDSGIFRILYIF